MNKPSIPNPKPCAITKDTFTSLHLDAIANISHEKIYRDGITFTVLVTPNPSNANVYNDQASKVYKVDMISEVRQKYQEKYLPKSDDSRK